MATPKSVLVKKTYDSRVKRKLTQAKVYIPAEKRQQLANYVNNRLGGEYHPKIK